MSKSKVFVLLLMSFIGGVFLYSIIKIPPALLGGILIIGLTVLIFTVRTSRRGLKNGIIFNIVFGLSIIMLGAGTWRSHSFFMEEKAADFSAVNTGRDKVKIVGHVTDEPDMRPDFTYYKIRVFGYGKILVKSATYPEYFYGDKLKIEGRIQRPENFDDFDYKSYLAKENIFWVMRYPKIALVGHSPDLFENLAVLKDSFIGRINKILPEPHSSLLSALLLGARRALPADFTEALNRTGTSHIVAISGYNISLIAALVLNFLAYILLPRKASFWIVGLCILIFTLIAGAEASVVRAAVMGGLMLLAKSKDRMYQAPNALVLAGAVMIFLNPRLLRYDVGFQLSFLATLGLIYLSPYFENWFYKVPNFLSLRANLAATISAQIATLPILILAFGRVSLIAPLANILVLPAVPLAMLFGFLAALFSFVVLKLGIIAALPVWLLLSYQIQIVKFLALWG